MKFTLLLLFAVAAIATRICLEDCQTSEIPHGWVQISGALEDDLYVTLTVAIKLNNIEIAEKLFWEVSNPFHQSYGNYLSWEKCTELTRPDKETQQIVTNWLNQYNHAGLEVLPTGDYIHVRIAVKEAEYMLSTKFNKYKYSRFNSHFEVIRSNGPYFVPEEVASVIDFIGGVIRFPKIKNMKVKKSFEELEIDVNSENFPSWLMTPINIKQYFNIPADLVGKQESNSQATANFDLDGEYLYPDDLTVFQKNFSLLVQQPEIHGFNNATGQQDDECMIDIEYIMAIGQNVTTWFVTSNGTNGGQEPFLSWIVEQKNTPNSPWVHSVSYGDYESTLSYDYADRVNKEIMLMGLTGHTIVFASGDDGAGCDNKSEIYVPNFPASSPYVLSVGGIQLNNNDDGASQNKPVFIADSISSGGFSNYFPMPSYQMNAVHAYLSNSSNNIPHSSLFNSTGRSYPDIASFSQNVLIYDSLQNGWYQEAGTSCAAPVMAGIMSLLNDIRLSKGKPTLGFFNPTLYTILDKNPEAFTDITTGASEGCNGFGFNAAIGWDPVTGVGAVNFEYLSKFIANLK